MTGLKKLTIVALHHGLQWRDTRQGHLKSLLAGVMEDAQGIDLIAEESEGLPTTVAQRLACSLNVPWRNVDMDTAERLREGIYEELKSRPEGPLVGEEGYKEYYLPNADDVRERHWVSAVNNCHLGRVIFLCGLLHLGPLAEKFRSSGWCVEEINACSSKWYVERFGTRTIVKEDGHRWCECRPS